MRNGLITIIILSIKVVLIMIIGYFGNTTFKLLL